MIPNEEPGQPPQNNQKAETPTVITPQPGAVVGSANSPSGQSEKKPRSKKRLLLLIGLVLILAGAAAGAFYWKTQDKTTPLTSQKSAPAADTPYSILISKRVSDTKYALQLLNPKDGSLNDYKKADEATQIIHKPDGTRRFFYEKNTDDKNKTVQAIYYKDENGAEKELYSLELAQNTRQDSGYLFWVASNKGTQVAVYQQSYGIDEASDKEEIFLIDEQGKKQELLKRNYSDPEWYPGYQGVLTPGAFSPDDSQIYIEDHTCIQCDGPPRPSIFVLDIKTKKLTKDLVNPDSEAWGSWQKVSDTQFFVDTATESPLGDSLSYEETLKEKSSLYLYDTKTSKLQTIFKRQSPEQFSAQVVGVSDDNKTAYVVTKSIAKFDRKAKYLPEKGSAYVYSVNSVLAIDLASGKSTKITLPNMTKDSDVSSINEYKGNLIYALHPMYQPFEDNESSQTDTLYILEKGQTEARKLNDFKSSEYSVLDFIE